MEYLFNNIATIFQNAFITIWYWCNMYRWQLLLFILLGITVVLKVREMKVHFIHDNRKVV